MKNLIDEYIEKNKTILIKKLILDSSLSSESKAILINNNIYTIYDLLTAENKLKKIFYFNPNSLEEIEDYIFSLKTDITDEIDNFPQLNEWNMLLDALNEKMSLNPLTCVLCDEKPSAYSINVASNESINICNDCASSIKNRINSFLVDKDLW